MEINVSALSLSNKRLAPGYKSHALLSPTEGFGFEASPSVKIM